MHELTGTEENIRVQGIFDRSALPLCLGVLIACFGILIFLGEDSYVTIHDNLDSEVVYRVLLQRENALFKISNEVVIPQVMNGLKRNAFHVSALNVVSFLFHLFPPFTAYLINLMIIRIIAFAGIYLLSRRYLLSGLQQRAFPGILGLAFSLLPFNPMYGLSQAGIPLLIYSLFQIRENRKALFSWIFVLVYPFYSSLVFSGYAIITILIAIGFWGFLKKEGRLKRAFPLALGLCGLYLISELNLVNHFFFDETFTSHRTVWNIDLDLSTAIKNSLGMFLHGSDAAPSLHYVILGSAILGLILNPRSVGLNRWILVLFSFLVFACLLYGLYRWDGLAPIKGKISILRVFNFNRYYFLLPVAWYLLFALFLLTIVRSGKTWCSQIAILLLVLNLFVVVRYNEELLLNVAKIARRLPGYSVVNKAMNVFQILGAPGFYASATSYRQFFSEDLLTEIRNRIAQPQSSYRIASIGIHPSVTQYNGFYTLDSYQNEYDLSYKLKFRRIIASELEKSDNWRRYFDGWGSRCYFFSAELEAKGYFVTDPSVKIENLTMDVNAFKDMGGKYIFSAVEILNFTENRLEFIGKFVHKQSRLVIYLYRAL